MIGMALAGGSAAADFEVEHPNVEFGETTVETLGNWGHSPRATHSGEQSYTEEIERGVTSFWRTELELEQEREPGAGEKINLSQVTSENIFQFKEPGQYWLDSGFYFEYGQSLLPKTPNETTFGPILRKEV